MGSKKPEVNKFHELKRHGQSLLRYLAAHVHQNNKCAICGNEDELAIDHCHFTKQTRELLCHKCNRGLGHFNDDIVLLEKAAEYVRRNQVQPSGIAYKERPDSGRKAPEAARRK